MIPDYLVTLFGKRSIFSGKLKPEDKLSADLTTTLIPLTISGKLKAIWFHVPNEAGRNTAFYTMIQQAKGVVSGTADFIFLCTNPICIELKVDTKQSPKQQAFEEWCLAYDIKYYVCKTVEEVMVILRDNGILVTES